MIFVLLNEAHFLLAFRISQKRLAMLSRSLSTMLNSGVDVIKAVEVVGRQMHDPGCKRHMTDVAGYIRAGDDLTTAIRRQGKYFPVLFTDMVAVAEQTGSLPEVLKELANHYENNVKLRRSFLGWIVWPVIQLVMAIFVIALLILILGMLGSEFDPLGMGLQGSAGAMIWLFCTFGSIAGLIGSYFVVTTFLGQQRALHTLFLKVPVLGKCLQSFAVARFSWGFYLTQDAGMPIDPSLKASLRGTGNGAFAAASDQIIEDIMAGDELSDALNQSELFPEDFIQIVQVAESSGTVPEALHRLSAQFEDQARRSAKILAGLVGGVLTAIMFGFVIFFIFRLFLWYVGILNSAVDDARGGF